VTVKAVSCQVRLARLCQNSGRILVPAGKKYYFTGKESTYAKQEETQKFLATMPNIG